MVTPVKPLVVIVGETASGKSSLAMEVARRFDGEIISADSRAVYKHMDVGSAKPSKVDQAEIPHHLIDIVEPNQRFSAAKFQKLAKQATSDIRERGRLPLLVGGTGLYVNSVIFDYKFRPKPKKGLRSALNKLTDEELRKRVVKAGGFEVDHKNRRHMVRFLEVGEAPKQSSTLIDNTIIVGVKRTRAELRQRIEKRVEQMFRAGLRKEVNDLVRDYGWENESMTGIVYRLFKEYDEGKISMSEVKRQFVLKDLQLAKRQRTWFKRNLHIHWFDEAESAMKYISSCM